MHVLLLVYGALSVIKLRSSGIWKHAQWEHACDFTAQLTHSDPPRYTPYAPLSCTAPVWPKRHAVVSPRNPAPRDRASAEPLSADPRQPHRSQRFIATQSVTGTTGATDAAAALLDAAA